MRGPSRSGLAVGDRLTVTLERPAFGGDLLAHVDDGRVLLVDGGAPGDVVEVELSAVERRLVRARCVDVRVPAAERVAPFCDVADRCGGCPWHAVSQAQQVAALAAHVERALTQAGGSHRVEAPWFAEPNVGWRSTARLQVVDARLGYFAARSRSLVEPAVCAALTPEVEALRQHALRAAQAVAVRGSGTLRLTAAPGGSSGTIALFPEASARGWTDWARRLLGGPCHGVRLVPGPDEAPLDLGQVEDVLGPASVPHPAGAFVQAHQPGAAALQAQVLEWLEPTVGEEVLELYAGSGHFTLALLAAGLRVTAVELDPVAAARLTAEAARRGYASSGPARAVRVITGDAARFPPGGYRSALLDPPRAGARTVVEALARARPARLVYVACDPATLARDVAALTAAGARLDRSRAFELFPHTGHVEVVVRLTWNKQRGARP